MDRGQFGAHRRGMVCLSLAVVGGPPARSCLCPLLRPCPRHAGDGWRRRRRHHLGRASGSHELPWRGTSLEADCPDWVADWRYHDSALDCDCLSVGAVANLSYAVGIASCWLARQEAACAPSCSSRFDCRGQPGHAGRRDAMCRIRPRHLLSGLRLLDCRSSCMASVLPARKILPRTSFKTVRDWLNLRSLRSKLCLSAFGTVLNCF